MKVFGVSVDSVEKNRAFAEKYEFQFTLLCDTERKLGIAYGACDASGTGSASRISVLVGSDGNVEKIIDSVNVKTHASSLLNEL